MGIDGSYMSDTEMARHLNGGMTWRWQERCEARVKCSQKLVSRERKIVSTSMGTRVICALLTIKTPQFLDILRSAMGIARNEGMEVVPG